MIDGDGTALKNKGTQAVREGGRTREIHKEYRHSGVFKNYCRNHRKLRWKVCSVKENPLHRNKTLKKDCIRLEKIQFEIHS